MRFVKFSIVDIIYYLTWN